MQAIFLPFLLAFSLLFAQQAGATHTLHHAFEDLTQQQEGGKYTPHSDNCQKCADYAQLGSALSIGIIDFTLPLISDETVPHRTSAFRTIHILAAAARAPPHSA